MSQPNHGWVDNFDSYLPYRAEIDAFLSKSQGKPYPSVTLSLKLQDSKDEDLIQLCDLLLGAVQMALVAGSTRTTKKELGRIVARWCIDLRSPPWEQKLGLHRKFNVWAFPDKDGQAYIELPLQLRINEQQLSFF